MDNRAGSQNKANRRRLSQSQTLQSISKPSKAKDVEHPKSSKKFERNKNNSQAIMCIAKVPQRLCDDDPFPHLVPTKFQGKKCSSTITGCSDNKNNVSGSDCSFIWDASKPMPLDKADGDIQMRISQSEVPGEIGIPQTSEKPIYNDTFTKVNKATSRNECLEGIKMKLNSVELMINEVKVVRNRFGNISQATSKDISPKERLNDTEKSQTRWRKFSTKCSGEKTTFPLSLKNGTESAAQAVETVRSHSDIGSEGDTDGSTSVCKKNVNRQAKASKPNDSGKSGVKRKQSYVDEAKKVRKIQNELRQKEGQILRRSERIRNYTMRALLLDHSRRMVK